MTSLIQKLKHYFEPPQKGDIDYKYYVRTGECSQCGECCANIYLIHSDEVISSVEQFDKLKEHYEDYRHFEPMVEDQYGVKFKCSNLTEENTCGIYDDRPQFCRKYPSEDTLLLGGTLAPSCGFAL